MNKYRKRPLVIDAIQFNGDNAGIILDQIGDVVGVTKAYKADSMDPVLTIKTLEGTMTVSKGDWVIKGIKGELYPCKPDIFEATYELVDQEVPV